MLCGQRKALGCHSLARAAGSLTTSSSASAIELSLIGSTSTALRPATAKSPAAPALREQITGSPAAAASRTATPKGS